MGFASLYPSYALEAALMTQRLAKFLTGMLFCAAISICQAASAKDIAASLAHLHPQPLRDYFFYMCVHEYLKDTDLDKTDASTGYIFEFLSHDFSTLDMVHSKAVATADSIKARQHSGGEVAEGTEGKATILATCLEESRVFKIPTAPAKK
jgi:hypothetical protein